MYYCNKCNKEFKNKKDLYYGLCEDCYKAYLLEEIDNFDFSEKNNPEFSFWEFLTVFLGKIKKFIKHKK